MIISIVVLRVRCMNTKTINMLYHCTTIIIYIIQTFPLLESTNLTVTLADRPHDR